MDAPRAGEETPVDAGTPIAVRTRTVSAAPLRALLADADRPIVAWETAATRIVAVGATAHIEAEGPDRFRAVRTRAEAIFDRCESPDGLPEVARPRFYGGSSFTDHGGTNAQWAGFPAAWFVLPAVQVVEADGEWWLTATATGPEGDEEATDALNRWSERLANLKPSTPTPPPGTIARDRVPSREGWRRQVQAALRSIDSGELEKVVLAQSLTATLASALDVPAALGRLANAYRDCFRFAVAPRGEGTFFGATPEKLVARRGRAVETEALAGSTGRGDTPAEDEWLADELRDSPKDRHEHRLVVDAIRDQLDPLAATVRTGPLSVRRLASVQHLQTPISADLHTDDHVLSLVEALHPTPTVGGLPPARALETIRDSEAFDRGWYAGPIGWFDRTGDGEFAVAIRSALAHGADVTCFAGAGIVADSQPDREWEEVQLKYRPILDVLE
jgi:menaquinone-specific isochorismate synthase